MICSCRCCLNGFSRNNDGNKVISGKPVIYEHQSTLCWCWCLVNAQLSNFQSPIDNISINELRVYENTHSSSQNAVFLVLSLLGKSGSQSEWVQVCFQFDRFPVRPSLFDYNVNVDAITIRASDSIRPNERQDWGEKHTQTEVHYCILGNGKKGNAHTHRHTQESVVSLRSHYGWIGVINREWVKETSEDVN